jgi:hypothetical protein
MSTETSEEVRYPGSIEPSTTDGRDIDQNIALLSGEGSHQHVRPKDRHIARIAQAPWEHVPEITAADTTYYDRPMLRKSVWSVDIPIYYFVGGAAGAALTLGAALQLVAPGSRERLRKLSETCHWIGIIGSTAGAGFLIHDLGMPSRFLYMMRVFRPTSPMNMGVWILAGAAPTAITTGLFINQGGLLGRIGEISGYLSGLFGAALSGYTGVLVANTAIPVWQQARRWLPVMFVASSAGAAASIINIVTGDEAARTVARAFGTAGQLAEIASARMVEREADTVPKVGEALHHGGPAMLWKAATVLTAASLGLSLLAGSNRRGIAVSGWLGAAGSLCLRLAVHYMGNVSAREPRAAFHQQRAAKTMGSAT